MEHRKVIRTGGSLTVALPRAYCRILGIRKGDEVLVRLTDTTSITITPASYRLTPSQEEDHDRDQS